MSEAHNYHILKSGEYTWGALDYVSKDNCRDLYLRAEDIISVMGRIADSGTDRDILQKILNLYAHVFLQSRKREALDE